LRQKNKKHCLILCDNNPKLARTQNLRNPSIGRLSDGKAFLGNVVYTGNVIADAHFLMLFGSHHPWRQDIIGYNIEKR